MRRQLVKWVLVIFVTTVAFMTAGRLLSATVSRQARHSELSDSMRLSVRLLADEAAQREPQELEAWLVSLSDDVGVPLSVQELSTEAGEPEAGPRHTRSSRGWVSVSVPSGGDRAVAVQFKEHFARPKGWMVLTPLTGMLAVSVVAATLLLLPMIRRLERLQEATVAIGAGRLDVQVQEGDEDAIGALERHFNEMVDRVRALLEGQRQLLQAVAHEIRTPIARIRWAQEMVATTTDAEDRTRRLAIVDHQIDELDELISELLVFHRYDRGTAGLPRRSISVVPVVREAVERIVALHPKLDIQIQLGEQEPIVEAHLRSFERVLRNLLGNASKHAQSRVVIEVRDSGDGVVVDVLDDGPGVPAAVRERIFEPFARVDTSRNRGSGGVGLGLAIIRRIMDAHGGTITVGDADLGGARFTAFWPDRGDG